MTDKWEYCVVDENRLYFRNPKKSWVMLKKTFTQLTGKAPKKWLIAHGYELFAETPPNNYFKRKVVPKKD